MSNIWPPTVDVSSHQVGDPPLTPFSGPARSIRPRVVVSADEVLYPPTPSTVVSNTAASLQSDVYASKSSAQQTPATSQAPAHNDESPGQAVLAKETNPITNDAPPVAFHAGESQGLEFLSDICQPVSSTTGVPSSVTKSVCRTDLSRATFIS